MVLGTHHCLANCVVMNVIDDFYPDQSAEFRRMAEAQGVALPQGLCADLTEDQHDDLHAATVIHEKPLANALGDGFRDVLDRDTVAEIFRRL